MSKIELDKTDRKILAILQADGRASNQDVADQVSLSPSPCLRRIKRLEEAGVIRQYVALLDPGQIGLGLLAYLNVRLEKHNDGANAAGANGRGELIGGGRRLSEAGHAVHHHLGDHPGHALIT